METRFVLDHIDYVHPDLDYRTPGGFSVYVRPMIQIYDQDMRLCPMIVINNKPKAGLMDSEIDEDFLDSYWRSHDI